MGRLSLNPMRHIDRVGTIILPGFLLIGQLLTIGRVVFMFGWAKPVPVARLAVPRSAAGHDAGGRGRAGDEFLPRLARRPGASRAAALAGPLDASSSRPSCIDFILANLVLGLFNLLPIPPLDGGRIVVGLLPLALGRGAGRGWSAPACHCHAAGLRRPRRLARIRLELRPGPTRCWTGCCPGPCAWCFNLAGAACLRPPWPTAGASPSLVLRLEGFEGPLDLLLDLARGQKVDLAQISILALVEQYLAIIEGARRVRLELAADWLVMAAWLTWLKSRLLVPAGAEEAEDAEIAAEGLASRLADLQRMRMAALWLGARPQLGLDVFARGAPEDLTETTVPGFCSTCRA